MNPIVVLICLSLINNNAEHLFICLFVIYIFYLEKCLFKYFSHVCCVICYLPLHSFRSTLFSLRNALQFLVHNFTVFAIINNIIFLKFQYPMHIDNIYINKISSGILILYFDTWLILFIHSSSFGTDLIIFST